MRWPGATPPTAAGCDDRPVQPPELSGLTGQGAPEPLGRAPAGRTSYPARRPTALVVPLAITTEAAGVLIILATHQAIGWVVVAAPFAALLVTGALFRPRLELVREGIRLRQYPFSSLTRWDVVESVALTRAGNRVILAYRLHPGVPPPRRQPAAALLRAAGQPFDGGFFADSLRGDPREILAVVSAHLADPRRREALPSAHR
jgi:hypothetical protein